MLTFHLSPFLGPLLHFFKFVCAFHFFSRDILSHYFRTFLLVLFIFISIIFSIILCFIFFTLVICCSFILLSEGKEKGKRGKKWVSGAEQSQCSACRQAFGSRENGTTATIVD